MPLVPTTDSISVVPEIRAGWMISRQQWRTVCRILVLVLAVCQLWTTRYLTDADGTAYADVARAWLRGDWLHALNPYWSPLYIWLLTTAFAVFSPSMHWQLPLMHAVDLLGFVAAWAAWEWLMREWERWQGTSAHPLLSDVVGYCVLVWSGLRLTGLGWYNNADIFVMAVLLAAGALLVRVRRGVAGNRDYILFGLVLGIGFLAKTAVMVVIPLFLIALAILLRSWRERHLLLTVLTALALIAPFVTAISLAQRRFTFGDSGWLNYSWQVTGLSVEGYKENAYPPGPEIQHPIHVLLNHPRVLSYEQHLVGTLPIHSEPSWWAAGYPVRFNKARQLMILWSNIKFSVFSFRCPAIFLILLCLPFGARAMGKQFAQVWFLWIPAMLFAASYWPVYTLHRYLAGSYALLGFTLIAAAWSIRLPSRLALVATGLIPVLTAGLSMGTDFRHMAPQFLRDVLGHRAPWGYYNVQVAEAMRREGLQPGDRVAYIGFSLDGVHVGLERAHIAATVPEHVWFDDGVWGRPQTHTFPKPDEFWRSSPQDQQRVFDAFRSVGAKWVFADCVPKWADISGWQVVAETRAMRENDRPYMYVRRLE